MNHPDQPRPVSVHKVTLMVIDHDEIGIDELKGVIEHTTYPNRCISPVVVDVRTRMVPWHDRHPLNLLDEQVQAFKEIFFEEGETK